LHCFSLILFLSHPERNSKHIKSLSLTDTHKHQKHIKVRFNLSFSFPLRYRFQSLNLIMTFIVIVRREPENHFDEREGLSVFDLLLFFCLWRARFSKLLYDSLPVLNCLFIVKFKCCSNS
jgi:hypothetical protein